MSKNLYGRGTCTFKQILSVVVTTVAIMSCPIKSEAWFKVCNEAPFTVYTALGYLVSGNRWDALGWYSVDAGECNTIVTGDLPNQYYYLYGEAGGDVARWANGGNAVIWGGNTRFCIDPTDAFHYKHEACPNGSKSVSFRVIDTEDADNFTYSLWHEKYKVGNLRDAKSKARFLESQYKDVKAREAIASHQQSGDCRSMPPMKTRTQSGSIDIDSEKLNYSHNTVITLTKRDSSSSTVKAVTRVNMTEFRKVFPKLAKPLVPRGSCWNRYRARNFQIRPSGHDLLASADFRYQKWSCTENPFGSGYINKTRIFEKTVKLKIRVKPSISNGRLTIETNGTVDDPDGLGRIARFVTKLFDAFTSGVLGKAIRNAYNQKIQDLANRIAETNQTIVNEKLESEGLGAFKFRISDVRFVSDDSELFLQVKSSGVIPKEATCSVHRLLTRGAL